MKAKILGKKYHVRKDSIAWFVIKNQKAISLMIVLGLILSVFALAEKIMEVYAETAETYTVSARYNGRHKFVTADGNEWEYYGFEEKCASEPVIITFNDNGTETIYDDRITEIRSELQSLGEFTITYYCRENFPHICNNGDASNTATGTVPTPNRTVAVDPEIIPYGTAVVINGKTYIAEDCGGAINGNRIDILVDTHEEALAKGIETAEVYVW